MRYNRGPKELSWLCDPDNTHFGDNLWYLDWHLPDILELAEFILQSWSL